MLCKIQIKIKNGENFYKIDSADYIDIFSHFPINFEKNLNFKFIEKNCSEEFKNLDYLKNIEKYDLAFIYFKYLFYFFTN